MLSPEQIVAVARRKYPAYLRSLVTGQDIFPLEIRFGRPSPSADWELLQREIGALAESHHRFTVTWSEKSTRRWGVQRFPMRVCYEDADSFLADLGKGWEAKQVGRQIEVTRERCPSLVPWLAENAHKLAKHHEAWESLLRVCLYFQKNPAPNVFARQLPIEVPTKFIENNRAIIDELLRFLIPEASVLEAESFEERWHLKSEDSQIRFRLLDEDLKSEIGFPFVEATIPATALGDLRIEGAVCFIVENTKVFATFPKIRRGILILGSGKAAANLNGIPWLKENRAVYWGDMDDAGFGILSRLRTAFPHLESMFMDEQSRRTYANFEVPGKRDVGKFIPCLTEGERLAWQEVRGRDCLIEQEKIPQGDIHQMLHQLGCEVFG
jgi:hypothetical protein